MDNSANALGRSYSGVTTTSAEPQLSTPQQIRGRLSVLADHLEGQGARLSRIIDHLVGSTPREVAGLTPTTMGLIAPGHTSIWQQIDQLDQFAQRITSEIDRIA